MAKVFARRGFSISYLRAEECLQRDTSADNILYDRGATFLANETYLFLFLRQEANSNQFRLANGCDFQWLQIHAPLAAACTRHGSEVEETGTSLICFQAKKYAEPRCSCNSVVSNVVRVRGILKPGSTHESVD